MKRKKRSSIKDKDIHISKHSNNSNKHVMNGPNNKLSSSLTQKPITKEQEEEEALLKFLTPQDVKQ